MKFTTLAAVALVLVAPVAFGGTTATSGKKTTTKSAQKATAKAEAASVAAPPRKVSPKVAAKRAKIDDMAKKSLEDLFSKSPAAKEVSEKAVAWAAFDNTKAAFIVSGGGGKGVAVDKVSGERTYMKMGTGGVGLGLGVQNSQVMFFFETHDAFQSFLDKGWGGGASATAAAGTAGANADATFRDGVAIYQMNDKGLMASADVTGTKYWKSDDLN